VDAGRSAPGSAGGATLQEADAAAPDLLAAPDDALLDDGELEDGPIHEALLPDAPDPVLGDGAETPAQEGGDAEDFEVLPDTLPDIPIPDLSVAGAGETLPPSAEAVAREGLEITLDPSDARAFEVDGDEGLFAPAGADLAEAPDAGDDETRHDTSRKG
jgi:hypothetical protein